MAAREVPAPRSGPAGSCRPFPEPACPARAFLGMRSQRCWFGEPARSGGDWGERRGAPALLNPFPAGASVGNFHRDGPSGGMDSASLRAREERQSPLHPSPSPRPAMPLQRLAEKGRERRNFQPQPSLSLANPGPSLTG